MKEMTLEQKVGQLLACGFDGYEVNDHIRTLIKDYHIGNVILFSRNFKDPEQLFKLNQELQKLAMEHNGAPLFISIDQEGGMVTRIYKDATFFPGNMAIGAGGNEKDAYLIGKYMGEELNALGINFNLAPDLDVNNNPENPIIGTRSYGEDPEKVASLGAAYIKGLQESGVIATGKHFPGHGDTSTDSHLALAAVNHDKERLNKIELLPFKKCIKDGLKAIMSAHIVFPAYEKEKLPATLSYNVLTKLLREELGFKGIIITDCMEMHAIDLVFGAQKAVPMCIKAGADMALVSHTLHQQVGGYENLLNAVKNGEISEERLNQSVNRILEEKKELKVDQFLNLKFSEVEQVIKSKEHKDFAADLSERSVTIVKNEGILPIKKDEKVLVISANAVALVGADESIEARSVNEKIREGIPGIEVESMELKPTEEERKALVEKAKKVDKVIACTYNANLMEEQSLLINELFEANKNLAVIAMRNPYDIQKFKDIPTYVLTYEYTPISIVSVIKLLRGEIKGTGVCPVTL